MLTKTFMETTKQKQGFRTLTQGNKSKSLTTVRQLLGQMDLATKKRHYSQKKREIQLDREEIRKQMKQKWKDPGFCNVQFSTNKALKGRFLNEWQLQRIYLANRSYQTPKNWKGFKQTIQSRQFPKVGKQMYSQKFQKYLSTIQEDNQKRLYSPGKKVYTQAPLTENRILQKLSRTKFQAFTTQNKSFGMGTVVWKKGENKKFKTLDS